MGKINLIVAMSADGRRVIGHEGKLPWRLSADLKLFKEETWGLPIIMGRKTHDSIPVKLPGRREIVLTNNEEYVPKPGCVAVTSADGALEWAGNDEVFIIGGSSIYEMFLDKADRIYVTLVHGYDGPGDAHFPLPLEKVIEDKEAIPCWMLTSMNRKDADAKNEYDASYVIMNRYSWGDPDQLNLDMLGR